MNGITGNYNKPPTSNLHKMPESFPLKFLGVLAPPLTTGFSLLFSIKNH